MANGAPGVVPARRRCHRAALWWSCGLAVALIAALVVVFLFTPLTRVATVVASGEVSTPAAAVVATGRSQIGRPLLRVDGGAVRRASASLPWVRRVDLQRRWPHTLVIRVHEATAVAALPTAKGRYDLVDSAGRTIVEVAAVPPGVPVVAVDVPVAGAGALRAASAVADGLPASLRSRVTAITAGSGQDVRLTLTGGAQVRWGSSGQLDLKVKVLTALLARHATTYDVSAPDAPATS